MSKPTESPSSDAPHTTDGGTAAPFAPKTPLTPGKKAAKRRMPWHKKLLIGAGVLVAIIIMGNGAYWYSQRGGPDDTTTSLSSTYKGSRDNPNALPPSTGPNALDDASLQKDLSSAESALNRSNADQKELDASLNDKQAVTTAAPTGVDLAYLKDNGEAEMARRLTALYKLINSISSSDMEESNQGMLNNELGAEATTLALLRMKLVEEKTVSGASEIKVQLDAEYPLYTQVVAKAYVVKTAYNQQVTQQKLSNLQVKFANRITAAKDAGKDTAQLDAKLEEMRLLLATGSDLSQNVEDAALPQKPTSYDNDRKIMNGYNDDLKSAAGSTQAAFNLAKEIIASLKE